MLVHDLLWWGGLAGVLVLVRLSTLAAHPGPGGSTAARRPATPQSSSLAVPSGGAPRPGGGISHLAAPAAPPASTTASARADDRLLVMAGATLAASGVHAVMVLGHAGGGWSVPLFFGAVAATQAAQAWRMLVSPSSEVLMEVVLLNAVLLLVWAASRTVGVLGSSEAVGPWDAAVVVWQTTCIVIGARLLRDAVQLRPPSYAPQQWSAGTHVALGMTVLTLLLLPGAGHG